VDTEYLRLYLLLEETSNMLKKNININRKSNEFSQDELVIKFNVLRQTVLKWERGLSVLDSEMSISYRKY